ncbi:hypothetical protein SPSYN_02103 [Sporotomaculum syntrophicum]|uniref:Uncharacterized protein n=1 Tax=Sporotomaculum syntrophicum TaxID=182264 RepID=A0A9D3AWW1_9FIRM|nr:hypothetical protein SPSYN_02103 [Sporotomaculum syntrophicum]
MVDKLTLHEAMVYVLQDKPDGQASTQDISDQVYSMNLYRKKDGNKALEHQIFLRARNYPHLFELIDRHTVKLIK